MTLPWLSAVTMEWWVGQYVLGGGPRFAGVCGSGAALMEKENAGVNASEWPGQRGDRRP